MKLTLVLTALSVAVLITTPVAAQWLNHPTPGIPRTADGKPDLTASTPRTADGKPDFAGVWTGPMRSPRPDPRDVQPWAKEVAGRRAEDFFKTRPMFQCLPSGPETFAQSTGGGVWKRILQTRSLIAILNDDLTYRQIFMDGRTLEAAPNPTWMGYSVGRWDGDTLVVDSAGFNDRTWLNNRGLPHTESLRMNERYQRPDFGHLQIDVTFTDPSPRATSTRPPATTDPMSPKNMETAHLRLTRQNPTTRPDCHRLASFVSQPFLAHKPNRRGWKKYKYRL